VLLIAWSPVKILSEADKVITFAVARVLFHKILYQ